MGRATLTYTIGAMVVNGKETGIGRPVLIFECADAAFCPVKVSTDAAFSADECMVSIDDLINLGERLAAFKRTRRI